MALLEVGVGKPYVLAQNAINDALNGDAVRIAPKAGGVLAYPEALTVNAKRIDLYGSEADQGIIVTGAGGGAAPALLVTGTNGAVNCQNLAFSNVGSTSTYTVEANADEDWFSRVRIDGDGVRKAGQVQYIDNSIVFNATTGLEDSCGGALTAVHISAVNCSVAGITCTSNGQYLGCLAYNCNGACFVNGAADRCGWNASDDATAPGAAPLKMNTLARYGFINYAGGNFLLLPTTSLWWPGIPLWGVDVRGFRRAHNLLDARIVAGAHDPWPAAPTWATGGSSIRAL